MMVVIDLSIFREIMTEIVDDAVFSVKMDGFRLNKRKITSLLTAAIVFGYENDTFAFQTALRSNASLLDNVYPVVFGLGEILETYTLKDLKNVGVYFKNFGFIKKA